MAERNVKILLIEDNEDDYIITRRILNSSSSDSNTYTNIHFELVWVDEIAKALTTLKEQNFDAILLDFCLPDCPDGLESFNTIQTAASSIPIIILSGMESEQIISDVISSGAQDLLLKGKIDRNSLTRSVIYAIDRHRHMLKRQSLQNDGPKSVCSQ